MLGDFLRKAHAAGRCVEVTGTEFSFKRRLGLKMKPADPKVNDVEVATNEVDSVIAPKLYEHRSAVDLLTKDSGKTVDHRRLLSSMSRVLEEFRPKDPYQTPDTFENLKIKLSTASDLKDVIAVLMESQEVTNSLTAMFSDMCLAEVSQVDGKNGPLVEFPSSINENVYCKIAEQGMQSCPHLMSLVINFVVRKGEPVLPSHVLKVATLFSSVCFLVNHDLDAMVKIRSLTLQMDGLSNLGLNLMSDCGLSQCARSLSNHRDLFADIGSAVMDNTATSFPYQSILDNCDFQNQHLTLEVIEKESIDTSHLSTLRKNKEEALDFFCKEQVLLSSAENKEELEHFVMLWPLQLERYWHRQDQMQRNWVNTFLVITITQMPGEN